MLVGTFERSTLPELVMEAENCSWTTVFLYKRSVSWIFDCDSGNPGAGLPRMEQMEEMLGALRPKPRPWR